MRICCDINGTLTRDPAKWGELRRSRIDRLRALIDEGHEVILWTAADDGIEYAKRFADAVGLGDATIMQKPDVVIDDRDWFWRNKRVVKPDWLDKEAT